jgi:hypothetical protein
LDLTKDLERLQEKSNEQNFYQLQRDSDGIVIIIIIISNLVGATPYIVANLAFPLP